jgi:YjjI family glycine radical enzyme
MNILEIIQDPTTTYQQKVIALARAAENSFAGISLSPEEQKAFSDGLLCDLSEGSAPYRPRYILPDYDKFLREGSAFLRLEPPKTLEEALNHLLILYKHVPSITTMPVYVGNLDTLLEPFMTSDEARDLAAIRLFLIHLDRTITDSFTHANLGPNDSRAGRLILRTVAELKNTVPNLTLKYNPSTPDDFALLAIRTGLEASNPSFANDEMDQADFPNYGIASCYNCLPLSGGGYTLVRLNLRRAAEVAGSVQRCLHETLPEIVRLQGAVMGKRIRFIVEQSRFFEQNFLVKEGLVNKDRFIGMFGVYGLAEAVNTLLTLEGKDVRYGHSEVAAELAETIMKRLETLVAQLEAPYSPLSNGRYLLHAQSGISSDLQETPGARIPYGDEPEMLEHLLFTSRFHKFFPTGISDIFTFEDTAKNNPQSVLDVIKGAMAKQLRMFAFYSANSDLVRITGYLVKKSDMAKLERLEAPLHDTVVLGKEAFDNQRIGTRKVQI